MSAFHALDMASAAYILLGMRRAAPAGGGRSVFVSPTLAIDEPPNGVFTAPYPGYQATEETAPRQLSMQAAPDAYTNLRPTRLRKKAPYKGSDREDGVRTKRRKAQSRSPFYTKEPVKKWPCESCSKEIYGREWDMKRHQASHNNKKEHCCPSIDCGLSTVQYSNLVTHLKTHEGPNTTTCGVPFKGPNQDEPCEFHCVNKGQMSRHKAERHGIPPKSAGARQYRRKPRQTSPIPTSPFSSCPDSFESSDSEDPQDSQDSAAAPSSPHRADLSTLPSYDSYPRGADLHSTPSSYDSHPHQIDSLTPPSYDSYPHQADLSNPPPYDSYPHQADSPNPPSYGSYPHQADLPTPLAFYLHRNESDMVLDIVDFPCHDTSGGSQSCRYDSSHYPMNQIEKMFCTQCEIVEDCINGRVSCT